MKHRSIASLTVALLLVLSGCAGLIPGGATPSGPDDDGGGTASPNGQGFTYPSGYSATGITDSQAAVRSHTKNLLSYGSFTAKYRATIETPNQTVRVNVTQAVDTTERRALWTTTIGPRQRVEYYANGTVYIRVDRPGYNTSYSSHRKELNLERVTARQFVRPVISNVTYGQATTVQRNGERLARYESTKLTSTTGLFGNNITMADVSDFSATLLVSSKGVVRHAEYEATIQRQSGERTLSVVIDVSALNTTTVVRPNWVDQAASS